MLANINWIKIKNEYISTNISQRSLAKKYKISASTLMQRANKEKWKEQKDAAHIKIEAETKQKTVETIVKQEIDCVRRLNAVVDKLIGKIEEATEQLNNHIVRNKTKIKIIEYNNDIRPDKPTKEIIEENETADTILGDIDRNGLKLVTAALKDINEILRGKQQDDTDNQIHINLNWDRGCK